MLESYIWFWLFITCVVLLATVALRAGLHRVDATLEEDTLKK